MNVTGIILGSGAPNQCADGRKTKCAIILSEVLGLIRVYPISAEKPFPVWGKVECDLIRNVTDSRRESYKIAPDFAIKGKIENPSEKRLLLNECSLKSGIADPIDYQNDNRSSIAIVKHDYGHLSATMAEREPEISPGDPEFSWVATQAGCPQKAYIEWRSKQGKQHRSHLVGAEVYEGLRKNRDCPWQIYNNMQIANPDYDRWLLLGNMRDRRNVWVVVHLHRLKKQPAVLSPSFPDLQTSHPEGWPYLAQEATNEHVKSDQLALAL